MKDSIVELVTKEFNRRSEVGINKYGTTLDRDDLSLYDWLVHLQQELMDATLYVEKLKSEFADKLTSEDFDYWCLYNNVEGENRQQLEEIVRKLIHHKNV